jgi:hypothetical protein
LDWTDQLAGTANASLGPITGITYGNGHFVAMTETNGISNDPIGWWPLRKAAPIKPLSFVGNLFFGIDDGHLATSTNGITWIVRESTIGPMRGVLYGAGHYLAYGPNGTILRSGDLNLVLGLQRANGFTGLSYYGGVYQQIYALQSSTNLINWKDIGSLKSFSQTRASRSSTELF